MEPLTAEKARELLARAVAEKGEDYVYQPPEGRQRRCLYVHPDSPGCIVGHVFHYLGVAPEVLARYEGSHAGLVASRLTGVSPENPVAIALTVAQDAQDAGEPWGRALQAFDRELGKASA